VIHITNGLPSPKTLPVKMLREYVISFSDAADAVETVLGIFGFDRTIYGNAKFDKRNEQETLFHLP
jgi:hypothetical protein